MSTRHEAGRLPPVYEAVISAYATALAGSTLANSSRVAYLRRVRGFLTWVAAQDSGSPTSGPPTDVAAAARAAHRYSRHLRHAHYATTTIGSVIAAIEDFYARCGLGATGLRRGRDQLAPRL